MFNNKAKAHNKGKRTKTQFLYTCIKQRATAHKKGTRNTSNDAQFKQSNSTQHEQTSKHT